MTASTWRVEVVEKKTKSLSLLSGLYLVPMETKESHRNTENQ